MPKRERRRHRERAGFTEDEWRDWGKKFGRRMAKRGAEFGEEVSALGGRFSRHMKREEKKRLLFAFGFVAPILMSIAGIVFLLVGILALVFFNVILGSTFVLALSNFLYTNLALFFAIFLFSNYNEYVARTYRRSYWIISPITAAIRIVVFLWVVSWAFSVINTIPEFEMLAVASGIIYKNLPAAFTAVVVLGYAFVLIRKVLFAQTDY